MFSFKEFLSEASYTILPRNQEDIIHLSWLSQEARKILLLIYKNFEHWFNEKWEDYLPFSLAQNNIDVKFRRFFDLKKLYENLKKLPDFKNYTIKKNPNSFSIYEGTTKILKIISGEGTRNKKAGGGQKGKEFEYVLANDLTNFKNQDYVPKYPQIVKEIQEILKQDYKIDLLNEKYTVNVLGSKNQKRHLIWSPGTGIKYNPEGNIGKIIQDINITTETQKIVYFSLKYTSQYYIVNASIRQYLYFDKPNIDIKERNQFLKYVGFNPKLFCQPIGLMSNDSSQLNQSQIMKNWENIIKQSLGYGYVYVWALNPMKFVVFNLDNWAQVKISSIDEIGYIIPGNRKYAKIVMRGTIDNYAFKITGQFRSTTANESNPYYMRVLLTY